MKKSLFKNAIYKSILSFVNIVSPLLVGPYIIRVLDPELYGIYNKVYANFQLFLTFAAFGIYTFGVKEISKIRNDKNKVSDLLSNLFIVSIISNLIVTIFYIFFAFKTSSGITTSVYLVMLINILANVFYIEFVNEALENFGFITIKTLIIKILYVVSLFLFVRRADDIIIYAIIICLTVFFNNIVSFFYAKKHIGFTFKNIHIFKYLPNLFLILIITNIDLLFSQLDRVMLGNFIDNISVTIYFIPYYIVTTLAAIPYSIINVSIPRLSYLLENDSKEAYENTLNKSVSSLLFVMIPISLGIFVVAKEVILLYAGEQYLSMIPILMLACIIRIIISIESTLTNLAMYPNNQEKNIVKYTLIAGFSNLIFNFLLLYFKVLTPFTAMFTTGIAEIFLVCMLYRHVIKKIHIKYKIFSKDNTLYFVLGILFIPISYLIRTFNLGFWLTLILIIISCVSLYLGVLYIKKDNNLMTILNRFLGKIFNHEK